MDNGGRNFITGFMVIITLAAAVVTVVYLGKGTPASSPVFPPPVVSVAKPEVKVIADLYEFTGKTRAIEFAEVRARVEGFLQSVNYVAGAEVKKGDELFVIDPSEYQARCDALEADLLSAQAQLDRAEVDLDRVQKAVKANAVSREQVTQRLANRDVASAVVKSAEAALAQAKLKLGYTKVHAPISGVVTRNYVDAGSLVGSQEKTLLASVTQMDPMYVYFDVSEDLLLNGLSEIRGSDDAGFKVGTGTEESPDYKYDGKIDYIDSKVDSETGTVQFRGVIRNKDKIFLPGMFVRVRVPAGKAVERMLIDERALRRDLNGTYILIVSPENIVQQRYVTLGMEVDGKREVNSLSKDDTGVMVGIGEGEHYVVLGVLQARPGMNVTAIKLGESMSGPMGTNPADDRSAEGGASEADQK